MIPLSITPTRRRRLWTSVLLLALAAAEASPEATNEQQQHSSVRHRRGVQASAVQEEGHKRNRELYTELQLSYSGDESIVNVRGGAGNPNPGGTKDSSGNTVDDITKGANNNPYPGGTGDSSGQMDESESSTQSRTIIGGAGNPDAGGNPSGTGDSSGQILDDPTTESRIIGGSQVADGAYPFFVQWNRGCGGTLIDKDLVLTAAHCYDHQGTHNTVWVGGTQSEQGRQRTVVQSMKHPQYNSDTESYDFLILRLDEEIRGAIQPVTLNQGSSFRQPKNGEQLTVIGFGVIDLLNGYQSDVLLSANVNYISDCELKSDFAPGIVNEDIMFCAGVPAGNPAADACQGDSGGPIMDSQNRQIGVVSFGRGCGQPEFPGVYSRVSAVSNWIEQMRCLSEANTPSDCVDIRIAITYDSFPAENSWVLYDSANNAIYSSQRGDVRSPGLVSEHLMVRAGSYRLAMYDKVGDGMCCVYGNGFISVYTGQRMVETSGIFGHETSVNFEVTNSNQGLTGRQNEAYSNSVALRLTINYDGFPKEIAWQLINDNSGAVVDESAEGSHTASGVWTKDYNHLSAGHYWFSISDASYDGIAGDIQIDQIDTTGAVVSNKWYHNGNFGDFVEVDFEVV